MSKRDEIQKSLKYAEHKDDFLVKLEVRDVRGILLELTAAENRIEHLENLMPCEAAVRAGDDMTTCWPDDQCDNCKKVGR